MLYFDPGLVAEALKEDMQGTVEIARPALRDRLLTSCFAQLFAGITAPVPEILAVEESLLRTLALLVARHGSRPPRMHGQPPCVARAL